MPVRIETLQGGRSVSASSFSDPLDGPTGSLGENWFAGQQLVTSGGAPAIAQPFVGIQPSSVDATQVMKVSTFNNAAVGSVQIMSVNPVTPAGLLGRSQFCQMTVKRHLRVAGVNNLFAGIVVLMTSTSDASNSNSYILQLQTPGAAMALIRRNGLGQTGLIGGLTFADNDVLRLQAQINSADVTLRVFKNGIEQAGSPLVDNSVNRVTQGMPGFMVTSVNEPSANYVSEWIDFSCGPI